MATGDAEPPCEEDTLRLAREAAPGDPALARLLFAPGFGTGGELDAILLTRSEQVKAELFRRTVQAVVPVYVSSICKENCVYCNYRSGNQGAAVRRLRLKEEELRQEAQFLIEEKGFHCLELVYASDPALRGAPMCRHVELVRNLLERNGGGAVGISAEALEEHEYRSLLNAGLSFSVLWQETYDRVRYQQLHPGRGPKASFEYRMEAYERMLAAGLRDIGIGVLTGLSPWKRDWAMLIRHEAWLRQHYRHSATILGIPRLKAAPGALLQSTPFLPSDQEFLAAVALHNLVFPEVRPFISTRESFEMCVQLARGGGCLFTFNCTTIPGGYTLHNPGYQFPSGSYDAPVYSRKLAEAGLATNWNWAWYEEKLYGRPLVAAC
ncbi:MAG: radical SAM protein [Bryobacteraceae bacterium]